MDTDHTGATIRILGGGGAAFVQAFIFSHVKGSRPDESVWFRDARWGDKTIKTGEEHITTKVDSDYNYSVERVKIEVGYKSNF